MNKRWTSAAILIALLAMAGACENETTGPDIEGNDGVSFDAGGGKYAAQGSPSLGGDGTVLNSEFAVARADSVGGFGLISFDPTGDGTGNLFILQAPRSAQTFECRESGTPCHGRFIVGVREGSAGSTSSDTLSNPAGATTLSFDRWFTVIDGSLTVTQLGPDRLKGSFRLTLKANDGKPEDTIVTENGSFDVPYSASQVTDGALECLLSWLGVGPGSCR